MTIVNERLLLSLCWADSSLTACLNPEWFWIWQRNSDRWCYVLKDEDDDRCSTTGSLLHWSLCVCVCRTLSEGLFILHVLCAIYTCCSAWNMNMSAKPSHVLELWSLRLCTELHVWRTKFHRPKKDLCMYIIKWELFLREKETWNTMSWSDL